MLHLRASILHSEDYLFCEKYFNFVACAENQLFEVVVAAVSSIATHNYSYVPFMLQDENP